jgi:hypothetical protein
MARGSTGTRTKRGFKKEWDLKWGTIQEKFWNGTPKIDLSPRQRRFLVWLEKQIPNHGKPTKIQINFWDSVTVFFADETWSDFTLGEDPR